MLKQKDFPTVLYDDDGVFTDMSIDMLDFGRDSSTIAAFVAADDRFLFGRIKPFSSFYIEMATANTAASVMTVKYYDNDTSAFAAVTNQLDETNGMNRSGFVQWKNPNSSTDSPWAATTLDGNNLYWVEVTFDVALDASVALKGWNIVFSDDQDLDAIFKNASNFFPSGVSTGILYHQTARDEVVNNLRRDGNFKLEHGNLKNTSFPAQMIAWDIFFVEEVRLWAAYLALSYIFDNASTNVDDKHDQRARKYEAKANMAKEVYYISLDKDDDGTEDRHELLGTGRGEPSATLLRRG